MIVAIAMTGPTGVMITTNKATDEERLLHNIVVLTTYSNRGRIYIKQNWKQYLRSNLFSSSQWASEIPPAAVSKQRRRLSFSEDSPGNSSASCSDLQQPLVSLTMAARPSREPGLVAREGGGVPPCPRSFARTGASNPRRTRTIQITAYTNNTILPEFPFITRTYQFEDLNFFYKFRPTISQINACLVSAHFIDLAM
jgi:hypothetical protein